jgi:serine protease
MKKDAFHRLTKKNAKLTGVLVILLLLFSLPGCSKPSAGFASLRGLISDVDGQPISGAVITLTKDSRTYEKQTDDSGTFFINNISLSSPDYYSLTVEFPEITGYQSHSEPILLEPGPNFYTYQIMPQIGSITGIVSFTGAPSSGRVTSQQMGFSITDYRTDGPTNLQGTDLITSVPDELILVFRPSVSKGRVDVLLKELNWTVTEEINAGNTYIVKIPGDLNINLALEEALNLPEVEMAEINYLVTVQSITPNDPEYVNQWHLKAINMPEAWEITQGSNNVIIAILDSGYSQHRDLPDGNRLVSACSFLPSEDCDDYLEQLTTTASHGVHVAGIVGAITDNDRNTAGVCWNVSLMPLKIIKNGAGSMSSLISAIYWAIEHGAHVINLSLGLLDEHGHIIVDTPPMLRNAIDAAVENGLTVVAASGNKSSDDLTSPASYHKVISVGAVKKVSHGQYEVDDYSNKGNKEAGRELDLVAPGTNILSLASTLSSQGTIRMTGTSMAAPQVSGVVALLYAQGILSRSMGEEAYQFARYILRESAIPLEEGAEYDDAWGYGLLNALGALDLQAYSLLQQAVVFTGIYQEGQIHITSEMQSVHLNGSFQLDDVYPGMTAVIAWIDIDSNDQINEGDYLAITDSVSVVAEHTTENVRLVLQIVETPIPLIQY